MKTLCLLSLMLCIASQAQVLARVTVYTPGGYMRGAARSAETMGVGEHETASQGQIFDGGSRLALIYPGRFITFELSSGRHNIATSQAPKSSGSAVAIEAKPGEHYFLRLTTTSKGVWAIQSLKAHLELVGCEAARKEGDATKPLQIRHVDKVARAQVVDGTYFPRCQ